MSAESASPASSARAERVPPYSEEAERGVLGSVLLDASRVMDLCLERQIRPDSFYVPGHRVLFEALMDMAKAGTAVDVLTVTEWMRRSNRLDSVGGVLALERLIDATPTAAHAEYYVEIVRQKQLLRAIIACARDAEYECFSSQEAADVLLGKVEQSFFDITENQHGLMVPWFDAVQTTMQSVEKLLQNRQGLTGISTGFRNLDERMQGMRPSEMLVLAARPSMGKTSLAMNIAENVACGVGDIDRKPRAVGIFSLEMSYEALALRMLCSHASVNAHHLTSGFGSKASDHARLTQAASVLGKAPIFLDDTGGLEILELRARARRMKKKHGIELIVIDYLQLLHASEFARQGKQFETAHVSGSLKSMAKELKLPVLVLSQLNRSPDQRDKTSGVPKLSDLRDSGAIEQDADAVWMLRRPCKYPDDPDFNDTTLSVLEVVKNRNGPTGDVRLNFEAEYTRFRDRAHGVDGPAVGVQAEVEP
jgi:replicative DNA helicase